MAPQLVPTIPENEWLKILGKGMVTIPKKRKNVVLSSPKARAVPYRIYSDEEIKAFIHDDQL